MEDNLRWKTTFCGRQPSVEDNFWWKTTSGGRWSSVEDDLRKKTTFAGRLPSMEDKENDDPPKKYKPTTVRHFSFLMASLMKKLLVQGKIITDHLESLPPSPSLKNSVFPPILRVMVWAVTGNNFTGRHWGGSNVTNWPARQGAAWEIVGWNPGLAWIQNLEQIL